jgi:hypothetical protein
MLIIAKKELLKQEFNSCSVVCNVTGISYQILQPKTIKGLAFEQEHPLASKKEAIEFAKLSYREHKECANTILAGAILTILRSYNLRHDNLSSREANIYISNQSTDVLSNVLHFVASISDRSAKRIPKVAISEEATIDTWLWASRAALTEPITREVATQKTVKLPKTNKSTNILVQSIEPATRKNVRDLLASIKEIIAPKLYSILKISQTGNTMATMGDALRDNLIKALRSYDIVECTKLAEILQQIRNNSSVQESITRKQLDTFEVASNSFVSEFPRKKLTIAEMLAAKIAGRNLEANQIVETSTPKATVRLLETNTVETESNSNDESTQSDYVVSSTLADFKPRLSSKALKALLYELSDEVDQEIEDIQEFIAEPDIESEVEEIDLEAEPKLSFADYEDEDETEEGNCNDLPD